MTEDVGSGARLKKNNNLKKKKKGIEPSLLKMIQKMNSGLGLLGHEAFIVYKYPDKWNFIL